MTAKLRSLTIPLGEATDHQLLLHLVHQQEILLAAIQEVEETVAELGSSVEDLKAAVDGVAQRLLPKISALEDALTAAQADDATAAAAMEEANRAAADIRTEVDRLNALGADPSTPVDTSAPPVEPPVVEVPADPAG